MALMISAPGNSAEGVVVVTVEVKSGEEITYNFYLHAREAERLQA
jgi:hypothetical protein